MDSVYVVPRFEKPPAGLPPLEQCRLDRLDDQQLDAFYHAMIEQAHNT